MSWFRSREHTEAGVIIDIGSGSVLVAVVLSNVDNIHPTIVWSKREYVPLRSGGSVTDSAKSVMASLLNATLLIDSEGRTALRAVSRESALTRLQITISAPWSYTVTKTISYRKDEEFVLNTSLIEELTRTAQAKIDEELHENETASSLGLTIIKRLTTEVRANGYPTRSVSGSSVHALELSHCCAVAQEYLVSALHDVHQKILPRADVSLYSFMLVYYCMVRDLYPELTEYCLIDVTYEATEIGVVREGILQYCTHLPYGAYSLARSLAEVTDIPLSEAYGYIATDSLENFSKQLSEAKKQAIADICFEYHDGTTKLFHEPGDSLAIPKKLLLHADLTSEPFFQRLVVASAENATKGTHTVENISHTIVNARYSVAEQTALTNSSVDTALFLSAQFFHKRDHCFHFED